MIERIKQIVLFIAYSLVMSLAVAEYGYATEYTYNGSSIDWELDEYTLIIKPLDGDVGVLAGGGVWTDNHPWPSWPHRIYKVEIPDGCTIKLVGGVDGLFAGLYNLVSIDAERIDTSDVTSMTSMFANCSSLQQVDVSSWDVSKVRDMGFMFEGCSDDQFNPDVSNWDLSNTLGIAAMFWGCSGNNFDPDVSNWNVSNVQEMGSCFAGCSGIAFSLDLSRWKTDSLRNISSMFQGCANLHYLDLSGFDTSKAVNSGAFDGCTGLRTLVLGEYNPFKGLEMYYDDYLHLIETWPEELDMPQFTYYALLPDSDKRWVNIDKGVYSFPTVESFCRSYDGSESMRGTWVLIDDIGFVTIRKWFM